MGRIRFGSTGTGEKRKYGSVEDQDGLGKHDGAIGEATKSYPPWNTGSAADRVSVPKHMGHAARVAVGKIQGGSDPLPDSSKQGTEHGNNASALHVT